jgi:hypothetical protein
MNFSIFTCRKERNKLRTLGHLEILILGRYLPTDDLVDFLCNWLKTDSTPQCTYKVTLIFCQDGAWKGPVEAGKEVVNCRPVIHPFHPVLSPPNSNRSSKELPAFTPSFIVLFTPQLVLTSFQLTSQSYMGARIRASISGVSLSREGNGVKSFVASRKFCYALARTKEEKRRSRVELLAFCARHGNIRRER